MSSIEIENLASIPEVKIIYVQTFADKRGLFSETYNQRAWSVSGVDTVFVQDNCSISFFKNTLRGLHFQVPPFAQQKLVRVGRGRALDIVVDIRHGSPTYGRYVSSVLSAEAGNQILVPIGFAHGIMSLEDDTEISYKVSNFYSAEHDRGLRWDDPMIAIDWELEGREPILSERDQKHPYLKDLPVYF